MSFDSKFRALIDELLSKAKEEQRDHTFRQVMEEMKPRIEQMKAQLSTAQDRINQLEARLQPGDELIAVRAKVEELEKTKRWLYSERDHQQFMKDTLQVEYDKMLASKNTTIDAVIAESKRNADWATAAEAKLAEAQAMLDQFFKLSGPEFRVVIYRDGMKVAEKPQGWGTIRQALECALDYTEHMAKEDSAAIRQAYDSLSERPDSKGHET